MTENVPRRWLRFRLRTLFVILTALCCYLGWQASIVHHRKKVLAEFQGNPAYEFWKADLTEPIASPAYPSSPVARVPLVRRWLGDRAIQRIQFTQHYQGFSETNLARLTKTFPEADISERLMEPCHPGCFPSGTLVRTPRGLCEIQTLREGDVISTIRTNGEASSAAIETIFTTTNRLWRIETDRGTLVTTETQPLCVELGTPRPAGELRPDDTVLQFENGEITAAVVREVAATDRTESVFNLILDGADTFVAGGFVARSKPPGPLAAH
jgi:hypothetical protein